MKTTETLPGLVLKSQEPPVSVIIDGTVLGTISQLRLKLEAQGRTVGLSQTIEFFNWTTSTWAQIDSRNASLNSDLAIDVATTPSGFVRATDGAVRARLSWKPSGPVSGTTWSVSIDQAMWRAVR